MIGKRSFACGLAVVLVAGVAARLMVLLFAEPHAWVAGSDTPFYVRQGWLVAHGSSPLLTSVAPAYTWLLATAWSCFPAAPLPPSDDAIPVALLTLVRVVQVACSLGMIAAAAALARRWTGSTRAALVTGAGLALAPGFVLEPFRVLTESVFLALLYLGVLLLVSRRQARPREQVPVGLVLALAVLVRPVLLALPVALAAWQWLAGPARSRRLGAAVLLLAFAAPLAPWSASLHRRSGSWLPPGLAANLWLGAVGDGRWHGSEAADALRSRFANGPDDYLGELATAIRTAPARWLSVRVRNLAVALAQPHFAAEVRGPATRAALARWWRDDRRPAALLALLTAPPTLLKLALYAAHWAALVGGIAGLLRWRRRWRELVPLWAVILYFPCVHLFLTAVPRYLLPIQPALWIACALLFVPPPATTSPATVTLPREGA